VASEEVESTWESLSVEFEAQKKLWLSGQGNNGAVASLSSKIEWAQANYEGNSGPAIEALEQVLAVNDGPGEGAGCLGQALLEAVEDAVEAERRLKACLRLSALLEGEEVVDAAKAEVFLDECDLADEKLKAQVHSCLIGAQKVQGDKRVGSLAMPEMNAFDACPLHAPRGSVSARMRRRQNGVTPMSARHGPKGHPLGLHR
jgi:hypothetical protein